MKGGGRAGKRHTEPGAGFGCDFDKASALPHHGITCFRKVPSPEIVGRRRPRLGANGFTTAGHILARTSKSVLLLYEAL